MLGQPQIGVLLPVGALLRAGDRQVSPRGLGEHSLRFPAPIWAPTRTPTSKSGGRGSRVCVSVRRCQSRAVGVRIGVPSPMAGRRAQRPGPLSGRTHGPAPTPGPWSPAVGSAGIVSASGPPKRLR